MDAVKKHLELHVPSQTVEYCYNIWKKTPFQFKITKERNSKLGDFRYNPLEKSHTITINKTLPKLQFLITYLHEVAHHHTHLRYGMRVKPHGKEWKEAFQELLVPVLGMDVFPETVLEPLLKYLSNPKASSCSDHTLSSALHKAESNLSPNQRLLKDLSDGEYFTFRGNTYQKLSVRRTRVLCGLRGTSKQYLIPVTAIVEI